jgi:hypothetical protein
MFKYLQTFYLCYTNVSKDFYFSRYVEETLDINCKLTRFTISDWLLINLITTLDRQRNFTDEGCFW